MFDNVIEDAIGGTKALLGRVVAIVVAFVIAWLAGIGITVPGTDPVVPTPTAIVEPTVEVVTATPVIVEPTATDALETPTIEPTGTLTTTTEGG